MVRVRLLYVTVEARDREPVLATLMFDVFAAGPRAVALDATNLPTFTSIVPVNVFDPARDTDPDAVFEIVRFPDPATTLLTVSIVDEKS
jgi:hypothetical protein